MYKYILSRVIQAVILIFVVSLIMFMLIRASPGGPAILLQQDISAEVAGRLRENLGLDRPAHIQYVYWLGNMLRGDLGVSFSNSRPVAQLISQRFGATAWLASAALLLAIMVGIPLGIVSSIKRYSWIDYLATGIAFFGVSIPVFWMGIMMIIIFSVNLHWLPSGGMYTLGQDFSLIDRLRHLIMPAIVLSTASMAQLTRYTRSSMLSVIKEDYIRTARAKGVKQHRILYRHALRNALIPVITVIGILLPRLFSGAAITESIFAWPGIGRLAVDAAFQRDYPVIMALTLVVSSLVIVATLIVDMLYAVVDPRIKYD